MESLKLDGRRYSRSLRPRRPGRGRWCESWRRLASLAAGRHCIPGGYSPGRTCTGQGIEVVVERVVGEMVEIVGFAGEPAQLIVEPVDRGHFMSSRGDRRLVAIRIHDTLSTIPLGRPQ